MYRRLEVTSRRLEEHGLTHIKNQSMMLRRLTNGMDISALKVLIDVTEPLKLYHRHNQGVTYSIFSPLTRVVDAALPDASKAWNFRKLAASYVEGKDKPCPEITAALLKDLEIWKENHKKLLPVIEHSPVLREIETLSEDLSKIAGIGITAVKLLSAGKKPEAQWLEESKKILEAAKKPRGHAELMIVSAIEQLLSTLQ
jgi:hexosaminidase